MATSLLALLDDIASILDDVATLTKVAAHKTAGVVGDDLALNAQQVTGLQANRELPVVWAVAKGSFINKAILVPAALAISAIAPWAVTPLLMVGGAYLAFEAAEKLAHRLLHSREEDAAEHEALLQAVANEQVDLCAREREKIRGAVRTDFILSAEIMVISLGTVAGAAFGTRVLVMAVMAILMTVGVYGLVAGIVKLDDLGLYLSQRQAAVPRALGTGLLHGAPWLMKALSVGGTAAMFLVGGSILAHGLPAVSDLIAAASQGALAGIVTLLLELAVGVVIGAMLVVGYALFRHLRAKPTLPA